jgi:membrane associated rhomboid family serine protease
MDILVFFIVVLIIDLLLSSIIFPLPVSDTDKVRYQSLPWATIMLISINALVYILWQAPHLIGALQAQTEQQFYYYSFNRAAQDWTYGFRRTTLQTGASIGAFVTFTSMFMHADPSHIFFNMVYLWTFGRRVEDACGPWRYLLFYLFAGMVANMGGAILNPSKMDVPGIGASGAISGVMGAYLILFPGAWINCFWVIPAGIRLLGVIFSPLLGGGRPQMKWTIRIPAIIVLVLFAVQNLLPSFQIIQRGNDFGGVNYLAHVTGFLAAVAIFFFVRKDLLRRYLAGRSL